MKITKSKLKQIVKEEMQRILRESFENDNEALKTELKQAWRSEDPSLVGKSREFIAATVLQFWGHVNEQEILHLIDETTREYNVENPNDYVEPLDIDELTRVLSAMAQQGEER